MKRIHTALLLLFSILTISATVDLTTLFNYASQDIPTYIIRDNTPPDNQVTDQGATLGRILFYDKKLSVNNTTSCASCHKQALAFGDTASASQGANGTTGRHAMRLINTRFSAEAKFFWDERITGLEAQATLPIHDHIEMGYSGQNGDPNISTLITKMNDFWYYPILFKWVYGDTLITETRIQQALAQFIRSIQSFDSKYDAGLALAGNPNAPFSNFTQQENQGKQLFTQPPVFDTNGIRTAGGAGCAGCHMPPEFSIAPGTGNNGITGSFISDSDLTNVRAPSLRDVVDKQGNPFGGFMHTAGQNGLNTLLDVVNHYDSIKKNNTKLDGKLRPRGHLSRLRLTTAEKESLVAFVRTLTGNAVYTDPRWSDPFTSDSLNLFNIPASIRQATTNFAIKLFPTVTTGTIYVSYPASMSDVEMYILNMQGKILYHGKISHRPDISSYASGTYLIRFANGQSFKFVKQ